MALNCIVISGSGRVPSRIQLYLENARFFELVGTCKDVSEAIRAGESSPVHYWLLDQETARANFDALLNREGQESVQVLIFGAEEVYFLDNFKDNSAALLNPEGVEDEKEASSVVIELDSDLVRELKEETPTNTAVNVVVKAGSARFVTQAASDPVSSVFIRSESRISRIRLDELLYVEAQKDYVIFHTIDASYRTLNSMKNIQAHLPESRFFRIHRSYIVRLDKIHTIHADEVLLDDAKIPVPIGPSFKNKLMKRLELL